MYWISLISILSIFGPNFINANFTAIINTTHVLQIVDEKYLSFCIDADTLQPPKKWMTFDFKSARVRTMMKGLSPAFLRFGGTSADYVFYTNDEDKMQDVGIAMPVYTMNSTDWDMIVELTRAVNVRFLFEFNIQLRYGEQWDPSNAIEVLDYLTSKGYGENIDFELGNEPDWFPSKPHFAVLTGERIAKDYGILTEILKKYPEFSKSVVVGPDTGSATYQSGYHFSFFTDFLKYGHKYINAVTSHTYYFSGKTAKIHDYYDASHFDFLKNYLHTVLDKGIAKSPDPSLQYWLGETSDSNGGGTPNVTNKYISGFLWMDKLGLAAKMGVKIAMRQTFYGHSYPLVDPDLTPNPDYWLSYIHKVLVGTSVLNVTTVATPNDFSKEVRMYAHCTKPSPKYKPGAITMFGLNVKNHTEVMYFAGDLAKQNVDVYLLTPDGPEGLLSRFVALNGKRLMLVDDNTLPDLVPKPQPASDGIVLPSRTFGFFVFKDAKASACI